MFSTFLSSERPGVPEIGLVPLLFNVPEQAVGFHFLVAMLHGNRLFQPNFVMAEFVRVFE